MDWTEIMSQGGIWAVFCYLLVKEFGPLLRSKADKRERNECAESHATILERLSAVNEARKVEAELTRETINRMADIFETLKEELRLLRTDIMFYLKGRD